jgi:VanZ family protein
VHAIIFIAYSGLVAYISLRPSVGGGVEHLDKLTHLLVYYIFAVFAYRMLQYKRFYPAVCLGIVIYGAVLEYAQSFTPDRTMSGYDMLANTLGVVLGALVMRRHNR